MVSSVDTNPIEDPAALGVKEEHDDAKSSEGMLIKSDMFLDAEIDRSVATRAKLYVHLADSNEWTDCGTGNTVTLSAEDGPSNLFIHFSNEKDRKTCYDWPVINYMDFSRSQGTIIMFAPSDDYQASLSFQTEEGADIFWKCICLHLGRDPAIVEPMSPDSSDDEVFEKTVAVPPIKLGTLSEIARIVAQAQGINVLKDRIATILVEKDWLSALKNLYDITADLEDGYSLALISSIVRSLLMLNREDIIRHLFKEDNLQIIFELLSHVQGENHPADYVKFLYETAAMKLIIRITDEDKERIQRAYRIQYLMDFILPPRLSAVVLVEDSWVVAMESYMAVLRSNILNSLMRAPSFKSDVVSTLESSILAVSHRRNLTLFLKEFFKMAENQLVSPLEKKRILRFLIDLGIFGIIKPNLLSNNHVIQKVTLEIMLSLAGHDTKDLLKFIVADAMSNTDSTILAELSKILIKDSDLEEPLTGVVFDLIKTLIDNEEHGLENSMDQKHFVSLFFRNHFRQVLQPLVDNVCEEKLKNDTYYSSNKTSIIICLATFFAEHHAGIAVRHIISVEVSKSIVATIGSKYPSLVLAALKFMKTVALLNDEGYTRHLIDDGILTFMVSIFCKKYKYANNLYNSAFLSFFEAVKDRYHIVQHIMKNYYTEFEQLTYCQTFSVLKEKYNNSREAPPKYGSTKLTSDNEKYEVPEIADSTFKPRPVIRDEDEGTFTKTVTSRPPTPMRIVVKTSRFSLGTAEDGDKENKESIEPIKFEPLRLVDYDDSDNESSSDREDELEDDTKTVPPSDYQPEQRGKKRKALEEGEARDTANLPKRSF